MASFNAPALLNKGGDDQALALEMAMNTMLEQFYAQRVFYDNTGTIYQRKATGSGKSWQFEWLADGPEAEEFTPGDEMLGQEYEFDDGNVTVDKPLVAHKAIRRDQQLMAHWDVLEPLIRQNTRKVAEKLDTRIAVTLINAANTAAATKNGFTVHPGGNAVTRSGHATIAAAYPNTVTGAKAFRDDAYQLARLQDEDNVPKDGRYMFVQPYIKQVLFQDTALFDKDLTGVPGDLNRRVLGNLAGYWLIESNRIPTTNITAGVEPNSKYQGDFTVASATGLPAAVTCCGARDGMSAIAEVEQLALHSHLKYFEFNMAWRTYTGVINGYGVLHPQAAGVIAVLD
jgi:hypothetical protein